MTAPDATAHIDVSAPQEQVYALVSDMPGFAAVAEEFGGGTWLRGASGPAVGAKFRGRNRNGIRFWTTVSKVTDAGPSRFAFEVTSMGLPVARWQYDIEPTDTGCRVTESSWDRRPAWFIPLTKLATGVTDRKIRNQRNIERTLAKLKEAAEKTPAQSDR